MDYLQDRGNIPGSVVGRAAPGGNRASGGAQDE